MRFGSLCIPAVAFAAAVFINSCTAPEPPPAIKEPDKLRPSLVYNVDSVKAFVTGNKGVDTTAAQQLEKAGELLPASPRKALYHVRNSITAKPTREAYVQLATLLAEEGELTEARKAFMVLTEVFPGFDRKLHFDMLYVSLLDPESATIYPFYDLALNAGITKDEIRSFLLGDKRLASFRKSSEFPVLLEYFARAGDKEETHDLYRFTREFPREIEWYKGKGDYAERSLLPLNIGMKELMSIKPEENSRIRGYREFIPEYLEKHDYVGFQPVVRLSGNYKPQEDAYMILLYAIDTSAYGASPEMKMIFYRLATFTWKDKSMISSRIVARQLGEDLSTLKLTRLPVKESDEEQKNEYLLEVQHYKRIFKKPFNYKDFGNEVVRIDTLGKEIITINEKGKIISRKK
jgi:hypothetical protein